MQGAGRALEVSAALVAALIVLAAFGPGCSDDGGSEAAFCEEARRLANDNPQAALGEFDPANPEAARADLERAVEQLQALEDSAPGEIRGAASELADLTADVTDALGELRANPEDARRRIGAQRDRYRRVTDASDAVVEYAQRQCGVDLRAPAASPQRSGS